MAADRRGISALSKFSARYTRECARLISKLPREIKRLVRGAIEKLLDQPKIGTELTGELDGYYSYRIRRYRIIYRVNEEEPCIDVYHVGHRREVYENLRSLLAGRN